MSNTTFRTSTLIGSWIAALVILVAASISLHARLSTTAFLFALGVAPGVVIALLSRSAPVETVAQLLHAIETRDGRP
jgi:hypothetical protein